MPHLDGTETLRFIREIDEDIQVIVVSGYASEDLARDLLKHGACDFFQKLVDLLQLQETVEQLRTLREDIGTTAETTPLAEHRNVRKWFPGVNLLDAAGASVYPSIQ